MSHLASSLFALAMAEAGAGMSETVTETTVTVTTEPVRKAGRGAYVGVWEVPGGKRGFGKLEGLGSGTCGAHSCWGNRKGLEMLGVAQMVQVTGRGTFNPQLKLGIAVMAWSGGLCM